MQRKKTIKVVQRITITYGDNDNSYSNAIDALLKDKLRLDVWSARGYSLKSVGRIKLLK